MKFTGFESADFDLFLVGGLEERMTFLKEQLRPKFHIFGEQLASPLSEITGFKMFPHVAQHARRKTNPPDDSWVAFAANTRGYKMMPHFQICVWNTSVLVQWGIIYEAKNKAKFSDNLLLHIDEVKTVIPDHFQWCKDHMKPEGQLHGEMTETDFQLFADRLKNNKNGEVMVGRVIPREDALNMSAKELYDATLEAWGKLNYLHQLAI